MAWGSNTYKTKRHSPHKLRLTGRCSSPNSPQRFVHNMHQLGYLPLHLLASTLLCHICVPTESSKWGIFWKGKIATLVCLVVDSNAQ